MREAPNDDDVELVPVPMDRDTLARLVRLAKVVNRHPTDCAADLLRDLMADDERTNIETLRSPLHS